MRRLRRMGGAIQWAFGRAWAMVRAGLAALALGLIETFGSARGRRVLAILALGGAGVGVWLAPPVRTVQPGEIGVRTNRLTGGLTVLDEGPHFFLPGVHALRRFGVRNQVYRPARSARAKSEAPFKSIEGLSIGVEVTVQYALDPARVAQLARSLPADPDRDLIGPVSDGILHRALARHTVRDIFSTHRVDIEKGVEAEIRVALAEHGLLVRSVILGAVDLPDEYRQGLESLLSEELSTEKMRYTLELKEKQVKQTALESQADKVKRETAAEAAGQETIIAAKARAEAMKHVLPFKEKEIEQRRLEAEAQKVQRIKQAEGEAAAHLVEVDAEAASRKKLADAEAYRIAITGKAQSEQLERDSVLIARNPLLIQKTLADKLSDKIQVIVAPPQAGGFFAGALLGQAAAVDKDKGKDKDKKGAGATTGEE